MEKTVVFECGLNNSVNYRIPSLITTQKGTLIAAIDARRDQPGDNPNRIDKFIRRSFDCGDTWEPVREILVNTGVGEEYGVAAIDPAMLQDTSNGRIWMLYSHTPAGIGLWNSNAGVGFDCAARRILHAYDGHVFYVDKNNVVVDGSGKETNLSVDDYGNLYDDGRKISNIALKDSPLREDLTSFVHLIYSDDDGASWSKPIDITPQVKESWMRFIGAGPGIGLQLSSGRLVFPIYYSSDHDGYPMMSCCLIYSDDHGVSWKRGASPNDGRVFRGTTIHSQTFTEKEADLTEAQCVELTDGTVRLYTRNHTAERRILFADSRDGGETFSQLERDPFLVNPICQFSVITTGHGLMLSTPYSDSNRVNGKVLLNRDGKWSDYLQLEEDSFIYSCLTELPDGSFGVLYEHMTTENEEDMKIFYRRFTVDQMKPVDFIDN